MNGKERKPKKCSIPEEEIQKLGKMFSDRYYTNSEITNYFNNTYHKKWNLELIICVLESRGFLFSQETKRTNYGIKTYYRIMTKDVYEKIAEEHRENAKRRLLAAVSY